MKIYVTALKSNKQRYEYINTHLRTLNIDYEIIDAVDKKIFLMMISEIIII